MLQATSPVIFLVDDVAFTDSNGLAVTNGVPWPAPRFGTLHLWDSGTAWTALEPLKGLWNFATLDTWVAAAEANGIPDIYPHARLDSGVGIIGPEPGQLRFFCARMIASWALSGLRAFALEKVKETA